jgi:hypothetical protein
MERLSDPQGQDSRGCSHPPVKESTMLMRRKTILGRRQRGVRAARRARDGRRADEFGHRQRGQRQLYHAERAQIGGY